MSNVENRCVHVNCRTDQVAVEQSRPQERLDTYLGRIFPVVSRGVIQRLIKQGHITVNGRIVKPTHRPTAGEIIDVYWPPPKTAEAQPEEMPLVVLFEDEDIVVLNKPPGLVVHPGVGHDEHTLVNALLHHCKGQLSGIGGVARPGIVHRLDKDTSGCMVVAKNDRSHLALSNQFKGRTMEKVYHAVLCGELKPAQGLIDVPIARHPTHRKRMAAADGPGREARTGYEVHERLYHSTLAQIYLYTGRTHQIRVHFDHLGYPLVGDDLYGKRTNNNFRMKTGFQAPRLLLHAWRLVFQHPVSGQRSSFQADWPEDFVNAVASLRAAKGESPE